MVKPFSTDICCPLIVILTKYFTSLTSVSYTHLDVYKRQEQHRFGVEQREYFKKKIDHTPHYLTMTATPIPRSLTEIFFGGLDVSEIREKPKNRKEIKTFFTPFQKRIECFKWIEENIKESKKENQAFIIYPLIEESEKLSAKAVLTEYEYLKDMFKGLKVEFLHGKLKEKEKINLLEEFKKKNINVLISTTCLLYTSFATSKSEAKRLIEQGAVKINNKKVSQYNHILNIKDTQPLILKVGKKICKILYKP